MLIAVLSDIHDHSTRLLLALAQAEELGCTHLLFAGDMAEIATFRLLCEEWQGGIDLVFGNNEYERSTFARLAQNRTGVHLHGDEAELTLDGRRVYMSHYPHLAARAAASGRYDAAFYGHTHAAEISHAGRALLANPGEVCGGRYGRPSFGIYNTADNSFSIIPL